MDKTTKRRENSNTTIDQNLYYKIKLIAIRLSQPKARVNYNDLIEEGMRTIIDKYKYLLPEDMQD